MKVPGLNEDNPRRIMQAVRELAEGGTNAIGEVTLAASPATTTTVLDREVSETTMPVLVPVTSAAAGVHWWITGVAKGTFVINHPATAGTATFRYERRKA